MRVGSKRIEVMTFYEHKVVNLAVEVAKFSEHGGTEVGSLTNYKGALDKFGDQGWELASVTATAPPHGDPAQLVVLAWFKRPVTTGADAPAPPG